ncbi:hypothetical protein MP228_012536 [Amoeboaphelidium protococcarum]|nr:hypothetical protein MP228_012536 [Amoeboaphelidium protococcarum]
MMKNLMLFRLIASQFSVECEQDESDYNQNASHQVAEVAFTLGVIGGTCLSIAVSLVWSNSVIFLLLQGPLLYVASLCTFHLLEYYSTAINHPESINLSSFLLDHSREYWLAHISSLIEYTVWSIILRIFFNHQASAYSVALVVIKLFGVVGVCLGQWLRTWAMLTAGRNFTHQVKTSDINNNTWRTDTANGQTRSSNIDHQLVTSGIYSYIRHPSYCAFMLWTISLHLLLVYSPVTLLIHTVFLWRFFHSRIATEDHWLEETFEEKFQDYKKRTFSGIPFIR